MSPPMLRAIFMNSADCRANCCCRCELAELGARCMGGPPFSCLPWKDRTALRNSAVRSRDADEPIIGLISDGEVAAADANGISEEDEE